MQLEEKKFYEQRKLAELNSTLTSTAFSFQLSAFSATTPTHRPLPGSDSIGIGYDI